MSPAPVVPVEPVEVIANPWAQPTAYRPRSSSDLSANDLPVLRYANSAQNVSQYAPTIVAPAGIPQYTRKRVVNPVPTVPGKLLPER